MITIVFTGPCVYDPKTIGWGEVNIAYTGEYPVTTAERYLRQYGFGHRLQAVICNGRIVYDAIN